MAAMVDYSQQRKFDLRIAESQRQYLITALAQCRQQGYYGADAEGREEIDALHDMLADDKNFEALMYPYDPSDLNVLNDFTA